MLFRAQKTALVHIVQEYVIGQEQLTGGGILHLTPLRGQFTLFPYQVSITKSKAKPLPL